MTRGALAGVTVVFTISIVVRVPSAAVLAQLREGGEPGPRPVQRVLALSADGDLEGRPLAGARRVDRRIGVLCLGCGLPPRQVGALLGLDDRAVTAGLDRIGVRLSDRRRVSAEVESPLDARLGDQ